MLKYLTIQPIPKFDIGAGEKGCTPFYEIYNVSHGNKIKLYSSESREDEIRSYACSKIKKIKFQPDCKLFGDILIQFKHFSPMQNSESMFHFGFNVAMITNSILITKKYQTEVAEKDSRFSNQFEITCQFGTMDELELHDFTNLMQSPPAASPASVPPSSNQLPLITNHHSSSSSPSNPTLLLPISAPNQPASSNGPQTQPFVHNKAIPSSQHALANLSAVPFPLETELNYKKEEYSYFLNRMKDVNGTICFNGSDHRKSISVMLARDVASPFSGSISVKSGWLFLLSHNKSPQRLWFLLKSG